MTKFDKLFKINVGHNSSESFDFHDLIKTLLVRILRRKFPNTEIYTEFHPKRPNEVYPDIYLGLKKPIVFEIQKSITSEWYDKISNEYPDEDVIIIPLNKIESKWKYRGKELYEGNPLDLLRKVLEEYIWH